ncbi:dolichyl pyrophosphate Man9GlcNAc2 alpha-1,3-glucosyltransferase-like [Ornithodoros turicata]|uniref:dolichyl pyrophosphate Man9GlcNAc2 alpha-1,3-glucosyltransferase-like n=1 Tax=Ornithodoros turicata TaxID=34597 RepID=UPI003139C6F2
MKIYFDIVRASECAVLCVTFDAHKLLKTCCCLASVVEMMASSRVDDVCYFGIFLALLLRWGTSLYPYSGAGKQPMFGDYEAQRHWMEITANLPVHEWYRNSSQNDLQYWGLDYPPLTAYHSWICGKIASFIDDRWVALRSSRGFESYEHKLFMRYTALISDVLIFFPAIFYFWFAAARSSIMKPRDIAVASTAMLLHPGVILIDHGHFQYNCVSLGLALWGIGLAETDHLLLSALAFSLSLNYKQMALYYAIPFFCYLLGTCLTRKGLLAKLRLFLSLAVVVAMTFAACWAPYLRNLDDTTQVLKRLFPVGRGLFEDKVANIWCTLSVVVKLKNLYSPSLLAWLSGVLTLAAATPSAVDLLLRPTTERFRHCLVNCSLVFFLCSYQVHEKTILFPALAFYLLLHKHPASVLWFSIIATFSMFPLLLKDGLVIPYIALGMLNVVLFYKAYLEKSAWPPKFTVVFTLSVVGCALLNICHLAVQPPTRYPDLHTVLNAIYSCGHFVLFAVYTHYLQFTLPAERYTKVKRK